MSQPSSMPMILHLRPSLTNREIRGREGEYVTDHDYDIVVRDEDVNVFVGDELLFAHRTNRIPVDLCAEFLPLFCTVKGNLRGRGNAVYKCAKVVGRRRDGSVGRVASLPVLPSLSGASSVPIGYSEGSTLNPYAGPSAFSRKHPDRVQEMLPWFQRIDELFAEITPTFYRQQLDVAQQISPKWLLPGTTFSSVSVNRNWQTAIHRDRHNLPFAVATLLRHGSLKGGLLVFPQFRIAVDLLPGSVLIFDTKNHWHANTPIFGVPGESIRLTIVAYLRPGLLRCGSPELEEAKRRQCLAKRAFVLRRSLLSRRADPQQPNSLEVEGD